MTTIYYGFLQLIKKGEKVRCSRSGRYFHKSETVPDGKGGRISKEYDYWIHDQSIQQSKYKQGPNWQMGNKFTPTSMTHPQVDQEITTTVDYTVTNVDKSVDVDTTSGDITITLLLATLAPNVKLSISKSTSDANNVIINVAGSDKLVSLNGEESSSYTITSQTTIKIVTDGINKYYICRY